MRAQRISGSIAYHAEGPCWWAATGRLRFVDMLHGAVVEVDDDGDHRRLDVPSQVAAVIRPRLGGGAIVATESGIALGRAEDLSDLTEVVSLFDDPGIRNNEGHCDPAGRFWIGTMAYDQAEGAATVYRWDGPGHEPAVGWGDATVCNGLGFSPDHTLAYWNDTPTGQITVMDYDADRGPVDPRPLVRVQEGKGLPDGLWVDAEGGIWTAMNGGSAVHRYTPEGSLSEVVELPVTQVTACTFGGENLDRLFITTSRENLPDHAEPEAGSIYMVEPGVRGLAPLPFRG
ncbi:SMP-30/gluconolactonase/LRE family protein [Kocuria coralli]|uniref:SMP-30/gluconolactonase/LRE family protein n=1 Tax=Kocuria coralli TaxID=1461025 RepID=A0A5J5KZM1_9MICC|nr:SMP-30/gluconolactonase/LRE family protein [Kocuria coralli]KAA9394858.1 SMP-30/gluconolactonase/LRE family protein [Kocuria coralli]